MDNDVTTNGPEEGATKDPRVIEEWLRGQIGIIEQVDDKEIQSIMLGTTLDLAVEKIREQKA